MSLWEAPAKVNLSLEVGPPAANGYHPLRSLVLAVDWCDLLTFEEADDDELVITGADLPEGGENLVWKAIGSKRKPDGRPQLRINLEKTIPIAAGLGGGSANAAAALAAWADLMGTTATAADASLVGADVAFFLNGGLQWMEGFGEKLTKEKSQPELAIAVVVPDYELATVDVYKAWDRMGEPKGPSFEGRDLPPSLRGLGPFRNDLTPAALAIRPELGDFMDDLRSRWGQPVLMTGSGPGLFGWFPDIDEAEGAARTAPSSARASKAARPRPIGVDRVD
jgi:4-diphosphocytidyl-2-C-methyl-D-erythritol kinase